ncbi:ComGF family competence protein [Limosilactobacillus sp. STM2_1]|uniref:ComGF family competence protein n=1 Tax=Limosilactobacillus rudii TaxID=2759755 RepID=A0A7W3ULR3_9LACO|nr:ComGF family competence protein [Limosilactobacillus rudii]MBB1097916.1 ComGF family competence protein [Limosilactobacillus rudii]
MKKPAFTLVEGICALIIASLVVINISLVMTSVKKANRVDLDSSIDWYLFIQELESPNHRFEVVQVQKRHLFLYSQVAQRNYELKGSVNLFLTCVRSGGYLPLLDNVKAHSFSFTQLDSRRVLIEVERTNGKTDSAIVNFYSQSKH